MKLSSGQKAINSGNKLLMEIPVMIKSILEGKDIRKTLLEDVSIARTILDQLGGNKFIAMTGAKNLAAGDDYLVFKIGRNPKGISHVQITLNGKDLYDMEFIQVRGAERKVKDKVEDVYNDQLQTVFTAYTGLETHL